MRLRHLRIALLIAAPLFCGAAPEAKILLLGRTLISGGERQSVREGAQAIIQSAEGEARVRAGEIAFEARTNRLVCRGAVTLTTKLGTITGENLTLDFGAATPAVYLLNRDGIESGRAGAADTRNTSSPTAPRLEFEQTLPRLKLELGSRTLH